jgi:hypothetical protein
MKKLQKNFPEISAGTCARSRAIRFPLIRIFSRLFPEKRALLKSRNNSRFGKHAMAFTLLVG